MNKICTRCNQAKAATTAFYRKDSRQSSGLRPECSECQKAYQKEHYQKTRDRRIAEVAAYRENNKELINAKNRAYHEKFRNEDPVGYRAYRADQHQKRKHKVRKQFKARMASDPKFRIRVNLGAKFRQFFKDKPQGGFQVIVGYKVSDLHRHLERQFSNDMTWENYGSVWEIDHILPVESFVLPDEAAACWAMSNLRPLHKQNNRKKSSSRLYLI